MLKIAEIGVDYLNNPLGITSLPQFSWIIESDEKNIVQKSYRIQVSLKENFSCISFDSGEVEDSDSAQIIIGNLSLISATRYFVRVRIRTTEGAESGWSQTSSFVTGICDEVLWKGKFISAEDKSESNISKGTLIRGEIEVTKKVKEAYAFTTALGLYQLFLNGQRVGKDWMSPGWTSYNKRLLYQTYDISKYIFPGINTVGASLGAGWYKGTMGFLGERNNYGTQTAFMGQFLIRYSDGTEEWFATDESYKATDSAIVFSEIYDGETYDSRKEQDGWNLNHFQANEWKKVNVISRDYQTLFSQPGSRVKIMESLPVKKVITTPKGEVVLDFGQNLTGWVEFQLRGKKNDFIEYQCFEVLDSHGNVYTENLRRAKQTVKYIFKNSGEVKYHPNFTFQGFRYVHLKRCPREFSADNFKALVVYSEMESTGTFYTSNKELNQLQHNIVWSMKGNFLDIPTDCPQRDERCGWTGDAQIFCRTASYLMNTYAFFSKWLKDVAADQTVEGGVSHIVPDFVTGKKHTDWLLSQGTHSAAAWADVAVIAPWTLYRMYGDKRILRDQYSSMKKWIQFMEKNSQNYIWNYKLQFGDWVALDGEEGSYFGATPNDFTCTAYFAHSTRLFAKIAKVLGENQDAIYFSNLAKKIIDNFQKLFLKKDGSLTVDTQTAQILALYFELIPTASRSIVSAKLLELLDKHNGHLVTGFVGTPYFCFALSGSGHIDAAYDLLLKDDYPSWLYQVKKGATTIWEHWDGLKPDGTMWSPKMNSFNHYAYGAIGDWMYRVIAGIEIDDQIPGYKRIIFQPHIGGGLTNVEATHKSVYGQIKVSWKYDESSKVVVLSLNIPANTTAEIKLDKAKKIIQSDALTFKKVDKKFVAQSGSGSYQISYLTE